jgi:hypothetical protein
MQNKSQNGIAFVKCGIIDKLEPKPVGQKVTMAGTRTFRIPYQAPHPYLDWAKVELPFSIYALSLDHTTIPAHQQTA